MRKVDDVLLFFTVEVGIKSMTLFFHKIFTSFLRVDWYTFFFLNKGKRKGNEKTY